MRRPRPAVTRRGSPLAVVAACVASACSAGGDDAVRAGDVESATVPATASVNASGPVTAPVTVPGDGAPPIDTTRCGAPPALGELPAGEVPTIVRPCALPVDLGIHVIQDGTGREAQNGDTLIVDYTGIRAADGEMFDTSYLRGVPLDFVLGRGSVIAGWDVGMLGTAAGEVVQLDVPADMAYGDTPPGDGGVIRPGDALTFLIQVRAVIPPTSADDAPLDLLVEPSVDSTGVTSTDVTVGDGATVRPGTTAVVHLLLVRGDNLKVLLNTWERSDPLQILMIPDQTLPGMVTGLDGARVGGTRVITMPPELAFGPDGEAGLGLPADTDLIVVAEVLGVY